MMNLQQARVIDPVLTTVAQGYRHADRVGHVLFPRVEVIARGGKVLEFGRESFRLYAARRSPGGPTLTISFGYEGKPFSLVQDALNAPAPREILEDAAKVPGVDIGKRAVGTVMQSLTLTLEHEQAGLATNPDNYPDGRRKVLAAGAKWSNPDSNPAKDIATAKEIVRLGCGLDPNRMVISQPTFNALKEHPKIIERFKYVSAESITAQMLANILELETLAVGKATVLLDAAEDAPFSDVWGNCAVLAYVPKAPSGFEEPSFGYTYTLKGHPFVEAPWWDNGVKSWVYGVTYERAPVLTGMSAGFLLQDVTGGEA